MGKTNEILLKNRANKTMIRNQALIDYMADNLSKRDYDSVPDLIGATGKRWTRLLNGASGFELNDIMKIAALLNRPAWELIMEFGVCKDRITIDTMDYILESTGQNMTPTAKVA